MTKLHIIILDKKSCKDTIFLSKLENQHNIRLLHFDNKKNIIINNCTFNLKYCTSTKES